MSYLILGWSHFEPSGNQSLTVTIWSKVYKGTNTSELVCELLVLPYQALTWWICGQEIHAFTGKGLASIPGGEAKNPISYTCRAKEKKKGNSFTECIWVKHVNLSILQCQVK